MSGGILRGEDNLLSTTDSTKQDVTSTQYKAPDGTYKRGIDIHIADPDTVFNYGAFGETMTESLRATVRLNGTYNFIPSNARTFTNVGTATASDGLLKVTSGTNLGEYGTIQSFRSMNHKEGQGGRVRFSGRWPLNASNSWSGMGAFTITDEISFGYSGTNFGIWHRYQGRVEIHSLQVTGAAGAPESATVTLDGTGYTVPLTASTVQTNAREIADYINANASGVWFAEQIDDTVVFSAYDDLNKTGAFTFSSATATGTFTLVQDGVPKTSTHIAQASWNGTVFSGFDPSKFNTYEIVYQNGGGDLAFYVENPSNGRFQLVHRIQWTNNNTTPNMSNPSLRLGLYTTAIGTTTGASAELSYIASFVEGGSYSTRNPRSFANSKSISTTRTNIFSIRNTRVYNNRLNQLELMPRKLVIANASTKNAIFELRANPTVAGAPNFQNIGSNLIVDVDTAGTDVSADGRLLFTVPVASLDNIVIDLEAIDIVVPPTLVLVVCAYVVGSAAAADLTAGITWYEDV